MKDKTLNENIVDCFSELIAYTLYILKERDKDNKSISEIEETYTKLIENAEAAKKNKDFDENEWNESLFAICSWIDEMILCSSWSDRDKWQDRLLQQRYFNTTNAGEEFFQHLEQLPAEAINIREVYDICLSMGFRGRYFMPDDDETIERIIKDNRNTLKSTRDTYFKKESERIEQIERLFPEAYALEVKKGKRSLSFFIITCFFAILPVAIFVILYILFKKQLNLLLLEYFK